MSQSLFLRSLNFLAFRMNLISNGKAVSISYRKRGSQRGVLNPDNCDFYSECTGYAKVYQMDINVKKTSLFVMVLGSVADVYLDVKYDLYGFFTKGVLKQKYFIITNGRRYTRFFAILFFI